VFENRLLRSLLGREGEAGKDYIMRRFITYALHKILLGLSNQGG
jgi:hypothetical protein